jgi:short-subunit dehydrogenase
MDTRPVVVITGATNGLGRLAALDLARSGAQLGIVARSQRKVDELRREIEQVAPCTPVDSFIADLTSMRDVRTAGQQLDSCYERIDVLINNAGVHAFSQRITPDGFSEMTAVNYLAPWVLTNTLRDKLVASAPARVVTVAS